jgi:hypothetical protein
MVSLDDAALLHRGLYVPCSRLHPDSCNVFALKRLFIGFGKGLKVYGSMHIASLLLFRPMKLRADPKGTLKQLGVSLARSCAFTGCYMTALRVLLCRLNQVFRGIRPLSVVFTSFVASHALYFEEPQRRTEIAMFILPRVLEVCYNLAKLNLGFKPFPHADVLVLALAMGVFMALMNGDRNHLKSSYVGIVSKLLGEN